MQHLSPSRKGDLSESKAVTWLLGNGFEVFRNFCSTGPVDIVVMDTKSGRVRKIDVKTWFKKYGDDGSRYLNDTQRRLGVRVLLVRGPAVYWAT